MPIRYGMVICQPRRTRTATASLPHSWGRRAELRISSHSSPLERNTLSGLSSEAAQLLLAYSPTSNEYSDPRLSTRSQGHELRSSKEGSRGLRQSCTGKPQA